MAKPYEVYKCEECGNIVLVLHGGAGELVCCGEAMKKMEPKHAEMATEKHVPVVEKIDGGYRVYVGSTEHPMTEEHHIEWIALCTGEQQHIQFLKPGQKPEAIFKVEGEAAGAWEYCNLHGLWENENPQNGKAEKKEEPKKDAKGSGKYLCTACQYIYDPEIGDPDGGVKPGTAFADIPEDWVCPICGVGKDMFEPYSE